jgi:hypothetical protein
VQRIVRTPMGIFSPAALLIDTISYAGVAQFIDMLVAPFDFQLLCLGTCKNAPTAESPKARHRRAFSIARSRLTLHRWAGWPEPVLISVASLPRQCRSS